MATPSVLFDSTMPVSPPIVNKNMNPTTQSIGVHSRTDPVHVHVNFWGIDVSTVFESKH